MKEISLNMYQNLKKPFIYRLKNDIKRNHILYLMILPVVLYYIIFRYIPMSGLVIAFQQYSPAKGILGSDFVGFKNFMDFFNSPYFGTVLKNTLIIGLGMIVFGFPAPIILALLINELKGKFFTRIVQNITYIPHFISLIVICGIIRDFTRDTGVINVFLSYFGWKPFTMLAEPKMFVPVYIISGIWQGVGWGSIIYLAALSGIDKELYEASSIDGAGKLRQLWNVTLPGIAPTIIILFILKIGNVFDINPEKIILLYNFSTYETADVISTFVYRYGIAEYHNYSFSSAVGMFNSIINFSLLILANNISKFTNNTSLW